MSYSCLQRKALTVPSPTLVSGGPSLSLRCETLVRGTPFVSVVSSIPYPQSDNAKLDSPFEAGVFQSCPSVQFPIHSLPPSIMSYRNLLHNKWAATPNVLSDDTYLLSEVIFGHLMYHLSAPASFMTWGEDMPRRIQEVLEQVATHHPRIRPTAALRAMFVVLAFKRDNRRFIARNREAELLFMAAFRAIGAASDPTFTQAAFSHITRRRYAGSEMVNYSRYLSAHANDALSKEHQRWYKANAYAVLDHFLVSYLPGVVGELEPDCSRYRFMALFESIETPRPSALESIGASNRE